ncbi:glutamate receptor ionotropic, kainate 3 isoform X1 [Nasonia vitripennis]|uniref:Uncharacterized protein n=2 Tax=Nasonia vitripennis TaxID=7425 RepID=A0A7M7J0P5_NASVI|nr:glutamate receptor ionotropic, kainate 3 isoform X1 [Nasonia vitripennis]XP_016838484.1 glutamate receptor ionotropic, kainate 3 isoform X1 [Nasonia vitripennis]
MLKFLLLLLALTLGLRCRGVEGNDRVASTVIGALFPPNSNMRNVFSRAVWLMNNCQVNRELCEKLAPCDDDINCLLFHRLKISALMLETDQDLLNNYAKFGELAGHRSSHKTPNSHKMLGNYYGLAAIFGPHRGLASKYIQGLCDIHDLPQIVIRKEFYHDRLMSINLYPDTQTLGNVYVEMVKKMNWTSFTVLYEHAEDFIALNKLLGVAKNLNTTDFPIFAFRLGSGPNYSEPLLQAKEKDAKSIVIDCSHEKLSEILKQIQEVGMMTNNYQYMITSLDLQTVDLRPYQYSGVNITGIRILDTEDPFVQKVVGENLEQFNLPSIDKMLTQEALMFDAVALFAQAYKDLIYGYRDLKGVVLSQKYSEPQPWKHGLSMRNYLMYNTINGLTGPVMLDSDGSRRRFKLDILNLHKTGLKKVGIWNPDDGFDDVNLLNELKLKHFNILITMNAPYAMKVNFSKSLEGNDRYEGFVIDIIKELSAEIGFNYTFHVQEDKQNGNCNKTSEYAACTCTGMMHKILTGAMDMAITDLTITEERAACVDFSTAFWNLGMSILYKKPKKAPPTLFSFLSPFDMWVWIGLVGIYALVSLLFWVLGRLSPAEWTNPNPCIEEPTELQNQFTLNNSFWFTLGAIMQQGSEIAPISVPLRLLSGCWWFFCLIFVSTYTANLAAFLTIEKPVKVVRGIEDLYNQTAIKFGAKKDGSTFMYFKSSKNIKHRQLAEQMMTKDFERYMVTDTEDGIRLAQEENYAFIMESSSIEYIQYRKCDLEQAGPLIDQKSFAIAYKKNFEYHQQISRTISMLQERLVIKELYDKWWKERGAICFNEPSSTAEAMNLDQLNGVFLVLLIGVVISLGLTFFESALGIFVVSKKEKVSYMQTMKSEIKHICSSKATKPVLRRDRSSDCSLSEVSCDYTMTTQI